MRWIDVGQGAGARRLITAPRALILGLVVVFAAAGLTMGGSAPPPPVPGAPPAAPVAGPAFTDIGNSIFEREIEWLFYTGVSGGCRPTAYCPDAPVAREQMASFLARAFRLPATSGDFFTDDEGSAHETDINRLAAAGLSAGCAAGKFCPRAAVTREQMASFLARAFRLPSVLSDYFRDDNTSAHEGDINRMADVGITGGCASGRFCPRSAVSRGQMAAFLYRAFGIRP